MSFSVTLEAKREMSCFYASVDLKGNDFTQNPFSSLLMSCLTPSATDCSFTLLIYIHYLSKEVHEEHANPTQKRHGLGFLLVKLKGCFGVVYFGV